MIVESVDLEIGGRRFHRLVFNPNEGQEVKANALFYHGQGDYAERYEGVLSIFSARGIRCVVTDMQGHGKSEGKRGHVGDELALDEIVADTFERYILNNDLPYGVMGHSMGGLLVLRHLILAQQGDSRVFAHMRKPSFSWLSSPLLQPSHGRAGWYVNMVKVIASALPSYTISTQVSSSMCRHGDTGQPILVPVAEKPKQWHNRISIGWAKVLLTYEQLLWDSATELHLDGLSLLWTQGADDVVCPTHLAREMFELLACEGKSYLELEGMLHEPFSGEGSEALFVGLESWIDSLDLRPVLPFEQRA